MEPSDLHRRLNHLASGRTTNEHRLTWKHHSGIFGPIRGHAIRAVTHGCQLSPFPVDLEQRLGLAGLVYGGGACGKATHGCKRDIPVPDFHDVLQAKLESA